MGVIVSASEFEDREGGIPEKFSCFSIFIGWLREIMTAL